MGTQRRPGRKATAATGTPSTTGADHIRTAAALVGIVRDGLTIVLLVIGPLNGTGVPAGSGSLPTHNPCPADVKAR